MSNDILPGQHNQNDGSRSLWANLGPTLSFLPKTIPTVGVGLVFISMVLHIFFKPFWEGIIAVHNIQAPKVIKLRNSTI